MAWEADTELRRAIRREPASAASSAHEVLRPGWLRTHSVILFVVDLLVITAACLIAMVQRFGFDVSDVTGLSQDTFGHFEILATYVGVVIALIVSWMVSLSLHMSRDRRVIGIGPEEYKRVVVASVRLFGMVAIVAYLGHIELARRFVGVAFPLGVIMLVLARWVTRKWLHRRRRHGGWSHRVLVVGSRENAEHLVAELNREQYAGFQVVGVCLTEGEKSPPNVAGLSVMGSLDTLPDTVRSAEADTVAVVPSASMTPTALRRLGWSLEGTGTDLVVAPALTDVAGPRVHVRPVAGLPLLHVESPQYEGPMRVVKSGFDFIAGLALVVLLSPILITIAVAIKLTGRGPVLFRQERVGRDGKSFTLYKFRSMVVGAERMLAALAESNDHSGVLFKMRADPRVTRVGRLIRRYSLDELPQLLNVLKGEMSLVGPRPPLPSEVAQYAIDVRRRLLVKPGITGLWQVSGRSDLTWEDSVRLDLYYVENWSMTADMVILWKTLAAVWRRRGAY